MKIKIETNTQELNKILKMAEKLNKDISPILKQQADEIKKKFTMLSPVGNSSTTHFINEWEAIGVGENKTLFLIGNNKTYKQSNGKEKALFNLLEYNPAFKTYERYTNAWSTMRDSIQTNITEKVKQLIKT